MDSLLVSKSGPLSGEVKIQGSKNAALPLLAASMLTVEQMRFSNLPDLRDTETMLALLRALGSVQKQESGSTELLIEKGRTSILAHPPDWLAQKMRGSFLIAGPLLAGPGYFQIAFPGGCPIGKREIDQHIKGFRAMGAEVISEARHLSGKAPAGGLRGAKIKLDTPSVTGTENLLMAATLAAGKTVISNAACEPEVVSLADCLVQMGAKITGQGTSQIVIEGKKTLSGTEYQIPPDRIEAGSYLIAAAGTGGAVSVLGVNPADLTRVLDHLAAVGAEIETTESSIRLNMRGKRPQACDLMTGPYPAFPTDLQPPFMALLAIAEGVSRIEERVFEDRLNHLPALRSMGADIILESNTCALVKGVKSLTGKAVKATDLRAAFGLIIAGLVAEGTTSISGLEHLDRGYQSPELKLTGLGAAIQRMAD